MASNNYGLVHCQLATTATRGWKYSLIAIPDVHSTSPGRFVGRLVRAKIFPEGKRPWPEPSAPARPVEFLSPAELIRLLLFPGAA